MPHRFDSRAVLGAGLVLLILAGAPGAGAAAGLTDSQNAAARLKEQKRRGCDVQVLHLRSAARKKAMARCLAAK